MYKLKNKSLILSFFIIVLGIIIASASLIAPFSIFSLHIPLPVHLIGVLAAFLILNSFLYPKASTTQIVIYSIFNLVIYTVILTASIFGVKLTHLKTLSIENNLLSSINPLITAIGLIASFFALRVSLFYETIKTTAPLPQKVTPSVDATEPKPQKPEIKQELTKNKHEISDSIKPEQPISKPQPQVIVNQPEVIIIKQEIKEPIQEPAPIIKEQVASIPENNDVDEYLQENNLNNSELEALPDIFFDADEAPLEEKTQPESDNGAEAGSNPQPRFNYEVIEFVDYDSETDSKNLPQNIRLVEGIKNKNTEIGGTISSIAKLLVNQRDIENIIQINDIMQQIGCSTGNSQIVTLDRGIKIYEGFNKIKVDYTSVKDIALIDQSGFIIASIIESIRNEQTTCAIAAGTFLIIQNYVNQLSRETEKIFFETDDSNIALIKINIANSDSGKILYYSCSKDLKLVEYNELSNILDNNEIVETDFDLLKDYQEIKTAVIKQDIGSIIKISGEDDIKKIAAIGSTIFENSKVIISNINPAKLNKINIFTPSKILTLKKFNAGKTAILISDMDGQIKLTADTTLFEHLIATE